MDPELADVEPARGVRQVREDRGGILLRRAVHLSPQLVAPLLHHPRHERVEPRIVGVDPLEQEVVVPGRQGLDSVEAPRGNGRQGPEVADAGVVRIEAAHDREGVAHCTSPPWTVTRGRTWATRMRRTG